MLGQILWRQVAYKKHPKLQQGAVVFVIKLTETFSDVLYNHRIYKIPTHSFKVVETENDLEPLETLRKQFHNKRQE